VRSVPSKFFVPFPGHASLADIYAYFWRVAQETVVETNTQPTDTLKEFSGGQLRERERKMTRAAMNILAKRTGKEARMREPREHRRKRRSATMGQRDRIHWQ